MPANKGCEAEFEGIHAILIRHFVIGAKLRVPMPGSIIRHLIADSPHGEGCLREQILFNLTRTETWADAFIKENLSTPTTSPWLQVPATEICYDAQVMT